MDHQPPPPYSAPTAAATTSPRPPIAPAKIRLMCSYGGHIVPRPHDKSLYYAGGETRIVAVDRRTTAVSLPALTAQLSRTLFGNRPFLLKYQLPDEDLDSLISVITDEDLANMLEEHDRIIAPARIRLFLFPVKPESVGSALLGPKSESWFSDALKSTGILQKGQSADCGLLMGIGPDLEVPVESVSNSGGGGGGGGESKLGPESLVLETSSSFGSTSSSFSMSNSPPIAAVNCDDKGLNLLDRKNWVPSSAPIESDYSIGSSAPPPKTVVSQDLLIHVGPEEESSGNPVFDPSFDFASQKAIQVLDYPLSQLVDGNMQTPLLQGGLQYMPQYAGQVPISPYYPIYQMPMPTQLISCPPNQPYPIYLVPTPTQYQNIPMQCSYIDADTIIPSSRPPLHPQTAVITQPLGHKEVSGVQIAEIGSKVYCNVSPSTQISRPSDQGELVVGPPDYQVTSDSVKPTAVIPAIEGSEFDEDIAYNQIYKSQPTAPILASHYQTLTRGATMLSEPSVHAK